MSPSSRRTSNSGNYVGRMEPVFIVPLMRDDKIAALRVFSCLAESKVGSFVDRLGSPTEEMAQLGLSFASLHTRNLSCTRKFQFNGKADALRMPDFDVSVEVTAAVFQARRGRNAVKGLDHFPLGDVKGLFIADFPIRSYLFQLFEKEPPRNSSEGLLFLNEATAPHWREVTKPLIDLMEQEGFFGPPPALGQVFQLRPV